MTRPVVIGYDGSAGAHTAVRWGAAYAQRHGAPVHIVRAYEPFPHAAAPATRGLDTAPSAPSAPSADEMRSAARGQLAELAEGVRSVHPHLDVSFSLEGGGAEEALVHASLRARTVVLGSQGMSAFSTLLAGSTTMYVATHAHCSVIAVPVMPETPGRGHVVVGVDGSELSDAAVAFAFQEASETASPLVAVHAWLDPAVTAALGPVVSPMTDQDGYAQGQELLLAKSLAGWSEKYPDVTVTRRVTHGHPVEALIESAEGARLLVVGSRGHGTVRSILLGSVGHGLLHLAQCPVAIVRRQG